MPMNHTCLLLNKPHHTFNCEQCETIARLMETGFSMKETMEIVADDSNKEIIQEIQEKLNHGEAVVTFFPSFLPKVYQTYFESFICCMSFQESLSTSIAITKKEEKNRKQILQGIMYPTILLLGVLAGVYMFSETILPNMIRLMAGFQMDAQTCEWMQKCIRLSTKSIMICFLIILVSISFALQKKYIVKTYQQIAKIFPNSIFVQVVSEQFARFFLECQKRNIPTRNALQILMRLQQQPCVSYIAKKLDQYLNVGSDILEAMQKTEVEEALLRFVKISYYSSGSEEMLEGYLEMVQKRKEQAIRRYTKVVQCISYGVCGVVIVFVYQVLMMPMRMLQNL